MSYTPNIEKRIIVKKASQLSGVLDSSKIYYIDGLINMGNIEIIPPPGGLFLSGVDYFKSGLFSTEDNYTMFKTAAGVPTSNIRIQELNFWASGSNSKLFDLDGTGNFGAIEFNSCNLGDFAGSTTEIGELKSFRQFRTNDSGFFRLSDGLTFSGTWAGGFRIGDSIALSSNGNMTIFKEGTSLLFQGRCISDGNFRSLDNTTTVFGFQESNFSLDGGFQLEAASFNPDAPSIPNISESSVKAFFRDCIGIRNTRPGYEMKFLTSTETILVANTPTKVLGLTSIINAVWFTQTGNNEITYNSSLLKDFKVTATITIDGGADDEVNLILRKWNNSSSSYQDVKNKIRTISNIVGGSDREFYNIIARFDDMSINDRIELWVENISDNTSVFIQSDSEIYVESI